MSASTTLHLRSETKHLERRSALSPEVAKALVQAGYTINVERSEARVFDDAEYEKVGATLVPEGSWVQAPTDHIIVGLKELPTSDDPLPHTHIQFGHCYKNQDGWEKYLSRFARGGGLLYDIEFLVDEHGRRVAAFGYYAGYAGAAVALMAWTHQLTTSQTALGAIPVPPSAPELEKSVAQSVKAAATNNNGAYPRVIILGALGRCGKGAVDFCRGAGIPDSHILQWDMAETAKGGPFPEITASDVFVNCVYLGPNKAPPFVTYESLAAPGRKLRVICDVSCDPNSANNPIPIYNTCTTFEQPTVPVEVTGDGPPLCIVSIDHLPTLVAREASGAFSELLLPSLLTLKDRKEAGVWTRAEETYQQNVKKLPEEFLAK